MTGIYGVTERAALAHAADTLRAVGAEAWDKICPRYADALRTALPDLDDVTIGRVLIALTDLSAAGLLFVPGIETSGILTGLIVTGLQLTETEWREEG